MPEPIGRGVLTELINIEVGDRVAVNGAIGSVQYIGAVEPYEGKRS